VLFQSDVLTASARGSIAKPAAREVVNFIKARGLNVTRVVGGHGEVAPIEAIQQAAQ
jgi:hypothetical protein